MLLPGNKVSFMKEAWSNNSTACLTWNSTTGKTRYWNHRVEQTGRRNSKTDQYRVSWFLLNSWSSKLSRRPERRGDRSQPAYNRERTGDPQRVQKRECMAYSGSDNQSTTSSNLQSLQLESQTRGYANLTLSKSTVCVHDKHTTCHQTVVETGWTRSKTGISSSWDAYNAHMQGLPTNSWHCVLLQELVDKGSHSPLQISKDSQAKGVQSLMTSCFRE